MLRLIAALQNNFKYFFLVWLISSYSIAEELDCISIEKTSGIRKDLKEFFEQSLQISSYNQNPKILKKSYPDQCNSKIETDIHIKTANKLIFYSLVSIEARVKIFNQSQHTNSFIKNVSHSDGGIPLGLIELLINTFKIHNINIDETIEMTLFNLSREIVAEVTQKNINQVIPDEKITYNWDQLFLNKSIDKKQINTIEDLINKKDYENALLLIQQRIADQNNNPEPYYLIGTKIAKDLKQPIIALRLYESVLHKKITGNILNEYLNFAISNGLSSRAFTFIRDKNLSLKYLDNKGKTLFLEIIAHNDKPKAAEIFEAYYHNELDPEVTKDLVRVLKKFGIWQQIKSNIRYKQFIDLSADW